VAGARRRRSTESRESLASGGPGSGPATASSTLRMRGEAQAGKLKSVSRRGSRHMCDPGPGSKTELGISEAGKTQTQDTSDSEDYLRNKLLRSASEDGLNIPSTPEFSFDGNLTNSPYPPVLARRGSRIVSPASPVSESSSYQGSMPGSGRSEQDSYTTHSERSFADKQDQRKYFSGSVNQAPGRGANRNDLEEALLRSGYFLPEYKH